MVYGQWKTEYVGHLLLLASCKLCIRVPTVAPASRPDCHTVMQLRGGLQHPLLLQEDQDDGPIPDLLLLWLHRHLLPGAGHHVRGAGVPGVLAVRSQDL